VCDQVRARGSSCRLFGGGLWTIWTQLGSSRLQSDAMRAIPRHRAVLAMMAVALSVALSLAVSVAVVALPVPAASAAGPCVGANCGVVPDPDEAQYVGSGGLLLPGDSFTGTAADRSAAATCAGCRWALLPMCRPGGQGAGGVQCGPAASSCPPGQFRRIVMLLRPGGTDWQVIGLVCLTPAGPTTVNDLADRLHDVVVEDVPALRPSSQPMGGTLVQLPAIFASGQPPTLGQRRFTLVGFDIVLEGRASWTWQFGDGETFLTSDPGGQWPDRSISHTYSESGSYQVAVTSEWHAWFTVDGLGPFLVGGAPVTQFGTPFDLPVGVARAELVAD
jgi:hypothetical protein